MTNESRSSDTNKQTGRVTISDVKEGIHDSVIVGVTDKVIQNIVFVGQVLDFAKVEGLIPSPSDIPNFTSISSAFKATFDQRLGNDSARAIAVVGEILKDVFVQWLPSETFAAIPYRRLLREIAPGIVRRLDELHYWEAFHEPIMLQTPSFSFPLEGEVIWLYSLKDLWFRLFKDDKLYGIAELGPKTISTASGRIPVVMQSSELEVFPLRLFVVKHKFAITMAYDPRESHKADTDTDFAQMNSNEFRVFIIGLVIDLIRLTSVASTDRDFWSSLVDLLAPGRP